MHSSPAFRAAGFALLVLVACARAGKPCSGGEFRCVAADEMLECHRGAWVAASCRGPGGCSVRGDAVLCDMSGNLEGDRCPFASEGRGRCAPDGLSTIECRGGLMVRSNTCRRCALVNGAVNCEP